MGVEMGYVHFRGLLLLVVSALLVNSQTTTPAPTPEFFPPPFPHPGTYSQQGTVRFGYDRMISPSKLAMNQNTFQTNTKHNITWVQFPDSYKSIIAVANGEVDITVAHSVDIARAISRRLPIKLIWVAEELWDTEGFVVQKSYHVAHGGRVQTPLDMRGLTIGVTFGGTEHYALMTYYKEMQVDVSTNTLYQMQGCRYEGPPHCHHKPALPGIVNDTQCKMLIPCHYTPQPNAVNVVGLHPEELKEAWRTDKIQAVYSGWRDLEFYVADGITMMTNQELSNWGKVTFHGLVVSDRFMARTDVVPGNFTADTILTFARAHYYYDNNTKEFEINYSGKESVGSRISAVTHDSVEMVAKKLAQIKISTMEDQVSCMYLGCGAAGRIALALKDQAKFCAEIRLDRNEPKQITQKIYPYQLADIIDDYSTCIDPQYIQQSLNMGLNASYFLPIGAKLHIGYQITANYGRTVSIIIT